MRNKSKSKLRSTGKNYDKGLNRTKTQISIFKFHYLLMSSWQMFADKTASSMKIMGCCGYLPMAIWQFDALPSLPVVSAGWNWSQSPVATHHNWCQLSWDEENFPKSTNCLGLNKLSTSWPTLSLPWASHAGFLSNATCVSSLHKFVFQCSILETAKVR